ncbi:hypothetical protein FA15DRAFT_657846 [Coprinopsis marcescibilis]|uniref:Uncharacterized protein n=1 Tax=Coprinopsis marcescibilis TaxID=230819 RepID=A0A5C3KNI2_COPMA|nr:hypothetical protein FA15DRAFT_657846 [Coprinopsis marcescibilis]
MSSQDDATKTRRAAAINKHKYHAACPWTLQLPSGVSEIRLNLDLSIKAIVKEKPPTKAPMKPDLNVEEDIVDNDGQGSSVFYRLTFLSLNTKNWHTRGSLCARAVFK